MHGPIWTTRASNSYSPFVTMAHLHIDISLTHHSHAYPITRCASNLEPAKNTLIQPLAKYILIPSLRATQASKYNRSHIARLIDSPPAGHCLFTNANCCIIQLDRQVVIRTATHTTQQTHTYTQLKKTIEKRFSPKYSYLIWNLWLLWLLLRVQVLS